MLGENNDKLIEANGQDNKEKDIDANRGERTGTYCVYML